MTIYNLGSINIDHVYLVDHFPTPGETLASRSYTQGLGGKGANQTVAIARAGGDVRHIGAVGKEGRWALEVLKTVGADVAHVLVQAQPTGHAIIYVDQAAENQIVLYPGANQVISEAQVQNALADASDGDWLLLQNETNGGIDAAQQAKSLGLKIAYSAAPFEADAVAKILPLCDLLVLNEVEVAQCRAEISGFDDIVASKSLVITKGGKGADCFEGGVQSSVPAITVTPVDTTGAGDTFLGYLLARITAGETLQGAAQFANAAAALQVTRPGAIDAIPTTAEVSDFLKEQSK